MKQIFLTTVSESMPLYEYECEKCGHRFEKIQKFSDKMLKKCPECGGRIEQMISAPAVQFKGSGWYVTDYANKSHAPSSDGGKDSKDSTKEDKSKPESSSKDGSSKDGSSKESSSKESSSKESSSKESASKESTTRVSSSRKPDKRK
jgi:putative FmdB family regulatory protein